MPARRRSIVGACIVLLVAASVPVGLATAAESDGTHMVPLFEGQETQVPRYVLGDGDDRHTVTYFECPLGILPTVDGPAGCERVPGGRLSVRFEKLEGSGRVGQVRPRSGNPVTFRAISAGKGALMAEYQKNRRRSFTNRNEVIVEPPAVVPEPVPDAEAPSDRWRLRRVDAADDPSAGRVGSPMAFRLERCPPEQVAFLAAATTPDEDDDTEPGFTCEPVAGSLQVVGGDAFQYPSGNDPSQDFLVVPTRPGTLALEATATDGAEAGATVVIEPSGDVMILFDPPIIVAGPDVTATVRVCSTSEPMSSDDGTTSTFPFPHLRITGNDVFDSPSGGVECVPPEPDTITLQEFGDIRLQVVEEGVRTDEASGPGFAIATSEEARGVVVAAGAPQRPCTEEHLRADVNRDGRVDMTDLGLVALEWQTESTSPADINGDGYVDRADLDELAFHFGAVCPPPVDEPQQADDWFDPPAGRGGPEAGPPDVGLFIEPADEASSAPRPYIDLGSYEVIACDRARLAAPPEVTDEERDSVCISPEDVGWQVETEPSGAAIVASESGVPLVIMPLGYERLEIDAAIPQGLTAALTVDAPDPGETPARFIRPLAAVIGEGTDEALLSIEVCDFFRFTEAYPLTIPPDGTTGAALPDPGPALEAACEPVEAGTGSGLRISVEPVGDPGYTFLIDGRFVRVALRTRETPAGTAVFAIRLDDGEPRIGTLALVARERTLDCGDSSVPADFNGDRVVDGRDYEGFVGASTSMWVTQLGPSGDFIPVDISAAESEIIRDLLGATCR